LIEKESENSLALLFLIKNTKNGNLHKKNTKITIDIIDVNDIIKGDIYSEVVQLDKR